MQEVESPLPCQAPVLRWAKRFQARCVEGYLHLSVKEPWRNTGKTFTYILWPDSQALPPPTQDSVWLHAHPQRIAALVSAQIGFLDALGESSRIKAVGKKTYVFHAEIRKSIETQGVLEVGDIGQLQVEALAQAKVEVVWHAGNGGDLLENSLRWHRLGIAFVEGGEWMEPHPLGRAEWIKFYAALLSQSTRAESLFTQIETAYLQQRDSLQQKGLGLTAISGGPWQGIWHVPGGRSYPSQLARDAGLRYLWSDDTTEGSLPLSPEAVLARGKNAQVWLNPGQVTDLASLLRSDSRYSRLTAVQTHHVFNNDKRSSPSGGNDFWESGLVRPDLLLHDLATLSLLASKEMGDTSELRYWRRLP